ncbi:MAG: hypothetical protein V8Q27_00450 [Eubacteriales bacterium]
MVAKATAPRRENVPMAHSFFIAGKMSDWEEIYDSAYQVWRQAVWKGHSRTASGDFGAGVVLARDASAV